MRITGMMGVLIAVACLTTQAGAMEYGSFSLKPGEIREVRTGSTYRQLRVCNESGSGGAIVAVIGDHEPHTLGPGLCAEEYGDTIKLQNGSSGVASGTYRPIRSIP